MSVEKVIKLSRKLSTFKIGCSEEVRPVRVPIDRKSADITNEDTLLTIYLGEV